MTKNGFERKNQFCNQFTLGPTTRVLALVVNNNGLAYDKNMDINDLTFL